MHTPSPKALLALTLLGTGLLGCDNDAPPPSEVRSRLSDDLGHVLREAAAAGEGAAESLPGAASFSIMEKALGQGGTGTSFRVARDLAARFAGTTARHGLLPADPVEGGLDTDAVIEELNTTIFTDAKSGALFQRCATADSISPAMPRMVVCGHSV